MPASSNKVMAARLIFDGISKQYGRNIVLDSLTLSVEPGEIYGFLGPNGAGKSTAIRIAMGFVLATHGRGELLGLPFARARAARASVGYVDDAPVFFAGSALDSMLFAARLNDTEQRHATRGLRERALELLRWLDLPAEGKDARKFSRGMQQRLALAQALVLRPKLLILDEPTSALDPPAVLLVRGALERARDDGVAVFFSSHQLQEVEQLCDRAAFLDHGRLLHAGPMASLLQEGAIAHITLRNFEGMETALQPYTAIPVSHGVGTARGDRTFAVPVGEQQAFLERAWAAGAELVRVERERRTLEDLFAAKRDSRLPTSPTQGSLQQEGDR